jgi:hypothetical protein
VVEKYIIGAIYEKDATTAKESHQFRVGRTGTIELLIENCPMFFEYLDEELVGKCLRTSFVERFDEDDGGLWIYTENSTYRLDKI